MKYKFHILLSALLCIVVFSASGQLSVNGIPWSFEEANIVSEVSSYSLNPPDLTNIDDESKQDLPYAFSKIIHVNISPETHGEWIALENGRTIWRLGIKAKDALALGLYCSDFSLPEGVKLYVYNKNKQQIIGAFTSINNRNNGLFATELIIGEECILELNVPDYINKKSFFNLNKVSYAYRGISDQEGILDFCEIDVNCSPEGDNWQDEKKGIVRIKILVGNNEYWCSGSLVNNTALDLTPYVLTADHCAYKFGKYATPDEVETWIFYFNYEAEECDDPQTGPGLFSLTGAEKIANGGERGNEGSDFYLMRLIDEIPDPSSVYFNGWSAINEPSSSGVTIHHPGGDKKKISTYDEELISTGWQGSFLQSHWKVYWVETENNWGVTEGGSSGSPLFNEAGLIVGTLTGGLAGCLNPDDPDYYGKFSYHWDLNGQNDTAQLKPWLDPLNTGLTVLGGTTLGFNDEKAEMSNSFLSLNPNPAENRVSVTLKNHTSKRATITIIDVFGNQIYYANLSENEKNHTIDLSAYPAGIYLVKSVDGNSLHISKLIKR